MSNLGINNESGAAAINFQTDDNSWGDSDDDEPRDPIKTIPTQESEKPTASPSTGVVVRRAGGGRSTDERARREEFRYSNGSTASYGTDSETADSGGRVARSGARDGQPSNGEFGLEQTGENGAGPTPLTISHSEYYVGVTKSGAANSGATTETQDVQPSGGDYSFDQSGENGPTPLTQKHSEYYMGVQPGTVAKAAPLQAKLKPKPPPIPPPKPPQNIPPQGGPPPILGPKPKTRLLPPATPPKPALPNINYTNSQIANDSISIDAGVSLNTAAAASAVGIVEPISSQAILEAVSMNPSRESAPDDMAGAQVGLEPTSSNSVDPLPSPATSTTFSTTPQTPSSEKYANANQSNWQPLTAGPESGPRGPLQPKYANEMPGSRPKSQGSEGASSDHHYEYLPAAGAGMYQEVPEEKPKKAQNKSFFKNLFSRKGTRKSAIEGEARAPNDPPTNMTNTPSASTSSEATTSSSTKPKTKTVKSKPEPTRLANARELQAERERVWRQSEFERLPVRSLAKYVGSRRMPPRQPGEAGIVASAVVQELVAASLDPAALPTVHLCVSENGVEAISAVAAAKSRASTAVGMNRKSVVMTNPLIYNNPEEARRNAPLENETSRVFPIAQLSHALQDRCYQRVVAVITVESVEARYETSDCHVYLMPSEFEARRISYSVNVAFKRLMEKLNSTPLRLGPRPANAPRLSTGTGALGSQRYESMGGAAAASGMVAGPGAGESGWSEAGSWSFPPSPIGFPPSVSAAGFSGPPESEPSEPVFTGSKREV